MTNLSLRRTFIIFSAIALYLQALGVPAKPGTRIKMQPDGTEITVTLHGDERSHYYLSQDGYLLINKDKGLYYGHINEQGDVVASDVLARPVALRQAEEKRFLQSLDRENVMRSYETQAPSKSRLSSSAILASRAEYEVMVNEATQSKSFGVGLFPNYTFQAIGKKKSIVILVNYTDVKFTMDNPNDFYSRMMNEKGFSDYGGTGSVRDYFIACSDSLFQPTFDVFGPVELSHERAYYGSNDQWGNDAHAEEMVIEACAAIDKTVDFSEYDTDGDGAVDNVTIIYAGDGEAGSGPEESIWPHSYDISYLTTKVYKYDGVRVDHYACVNELEKSYKSDTEQFIDGIGTFVHEFSHVIGLPDLYSTGSSTVFTPGTWSVLDTGSYNNHGRTPPLYSIFERNAQKWLSPVVIKENAWLSLPSIVNNVGFIIETPSKKEFYLLENRQKTGWDAYLPGHGMLIWHVDFDSHEWEYNSVNNNKYHQRVDLIEADGTETEMTRNADSWPGTKKCKEFTFQTTPSLCTWDGDSLGIAITQISELSGVIKFLCTNTEVKEDAGIADIGIDSDEISISQGSVFVKGEGVVEIYSMDGRLIIRGMANQNLPLSPGLYILRHGEKALKIRIK